MALLGCCAGGVDVFRVMDTTAGVGQAAVHAVQRMISEPPRPRRAAEEYWGKAVPGFGDPAARLVLVGLAPAAHGGNRTGRMFPGDRFGDWLFRALYRAGFANQPTSRSRDDALKLRDAYITATAACRCAPPDHRPTGEELAACRPDLVRELQLLERARVLVCLGQVAFASTLAALAELGAGRPEPANSEATLPPRFRHGALFHWRTLPWRAGERWLLASYHPSQRNTQTGLLSEAMFEAIFAEARTLLADSSSSMTGRGCTAIPRRLIKPTPGLWHTSTTCRSMCSPAMKASAVPFHPMRPSGRMG